MFDRHRVSANYTLLFASRCPIAGRFFFWGRRLGRGGFWEVQTVLFLSLVGNVAVVELGRGEQMVLLDVYLHILYICIKECYSDQTGAINS